MSAAGRVCTGFSKPYVALYSASGGVISYTSGQLLARGVNVSVTPESGDDNNFHADNILAETGDATFTGGEASLTIDGLLTQAERLIMGLPEANQAGWIVYDDDQAVPYVGIGFIARYQSGGAVTYVPYVLLKCKFNQIGTTAATQEENIDYQTQELTAKIFRSDDAKHSWKTVGTEQTTESAAETELRTKLGIASS